VRPGPDRLLRRGRLRGAGAGAAGVRPQLRGGQLRRRRRGVGVRPPAAGDQPVLRPADRPVRGAAGDGGRHLHRRRVQRRGRHLPDLRAAAGAARDRRRRLGDVHRLGHHAAADLGRGRAARAGRRLLPGRLPARRDDRAGDRRRAVGDRPDRAVLLLRRHAGGGGHRRAGPAADAERARRRAGPARRPLPPGAARQAVPGGVRDEPRPGLDLLRRPQHPGPRAGGRGAAASDVVDRHRLRGGRRGPDPGRRAGRPVRGHRRPPSRHDRRRGPGRALHPRGAVRPGDRPADRRAQPVRRRRGLPGHGARGLRRRRGGRPGRHRRRGLLHVRRHRGDRRPAGRGAAGRLLLLPGGLRRRGGAAARRRGRLRPDAANRPGGGGPCPRPL
ncbi:MAG: Uncharacterized MFS-type transporter, partial [uncultured Friedmanniella sp.]